MLGETDFATWRDAHCPTCRKYPELAERASMCIVYRCSMLDREIFRSEHAFVNAIMPRLWQEFPFNDRAISDMNEYIALIGCTTPVLVKGADGICREGLSAKTLRAKLHRAIFVLLSALTGNTIKGNTHEDKKTLEERIKHETELAAWVRRQRVLELGKQGLGKKTIARLTGVPRGTVQYWLKVGEDGANND